MQMIKPAKVTTTLSNKHTGEKYNMNEGGIARLL